MRKCDSLAKDFPTLFPSGAARCGVYYGDGWDPLIRNLCTTIANQLTQFEQVPELPFEVEQIKEKFGQLRFYVNCAPDSIYDLISEYEFDSATICEVCGAPGRVRKLRRNGVEIMFLKAVCDDHVVTT